MQRGCLTQWCWANICTRQCQWQHQPWRVISTGVEGSRRTKEQQQQELNCICLRERAKFAATHSCIVAGVAATLLRKPLKCRCSFAYAHIHVRTHTCIYSSLASFSLRHMLLLPLRSPNKLFALLKSSSSLFVPLPLINSNALFSIQFHHDFNFNNVNLVCLKWQRQKQLKKRKITKQVPICAAPSLYLCVSECVVYVRTSACVCFIWILIKLKPITLQAYQRSAVACHKSYFLAYSHD